MPDPFYSTKEWKKLRGKVKARWKWKGWPCGICGKDIDWSRDKTIADHIKPRRDAPHLELVLENIQMVHHACNTRKALEKNDAVLTRLDGFPQGWGN